ncbi:MAG TPA: D-2-hydroxyacid dehydrogenase [Steroidobacteraceae bacterium]|nr:D-2-hydroxyacid dehydrogenase [Steroidobacteraceae bacterium]
MPRISRPCALFVGIGLFAALASAHSYAETPPAAAPDTAKLISELGLQEAPAAVRERPGWSKPQVIIVRDPAPHDVEWLREVAPGVELIIADDFPAAIAAAPRAEALIGFCTADILAKGPKIRWIQLMSAGAERCVSIPAVPERGILVTNMQRVGGPVMAEHVMALTLALARGLQRYVREQSAGRWNPDAVGDEGSLALQGKTMMIAGLGGIGTEVARRAHAFDMRIVATRASNRPAPEFVSHVGPPEELIALLREADVVVNALPLTHETTGVFDARAFAAMKPKALFINVGRGGTVVTAELARALSEKRLGGAGLDVTDPEPLPADHPLWRMPNVIITPHVSTDSDFGSGRHWQIARENLRRYVAGEPMLSVVDVKRGY